MLEISFFIKKIKLLNNYLLYYINVIQDYYVCQILFLQLTFSSQK